MLLRAHGKCCECSRGGRWDPKRACSSVFFFVGKSSFVASAAFEIWFHCTRISGHLEFVFNQENKKKERKKE